MGSEAFTVGNGANNKRFSVYPDGSTVIGGQGVINNYNILLQNNGQAVFSGIGIGTATPGRHLTVSGGASEGAIQITNNTSGHTAANGFELIHFTSGETQFLNRENGDMRFDTNGTERLRITSTGKCEVYKGTSATGKTSGSEAFTVGNGAGNKRFSVYPDGTAVIGGQGTIANNNILLQNDGAVTIVGDPGTNGTTVGNKISTTGLIRVARATDGPVFQGNKTDSSGYNVTINANGSADFAGTISDSIGPLRRLGINFHNAATYTLVASDAGKLIREATNGANITIPQNLFSAGDMISIFNASSGDNTITQGTGTTLYDTSDGSTGNRTLGSKGVCTIVCASTNEFIISGTQIS